MMFIRSRNLFRKTLEIDRDWSYALRVAEKPGMLRTLAMIFAHSGDSWLWGIGMVVLWLAGNTFWKQWAVHQLFWTFFLAVFVMALKFSIRRRRPEGEWGALYRTADPHSFPSGHAARAFLIAVISSFFGPPWLMVALWVWAPLVCLARVAMGVHYVSDVVAGAVIGVIVAWIGMQFSAPIFSLVSAWIGFGLW
jgi:membrane-associated phospholipid phosphatase